MQSFSKPILENRFFGLNDAVSSEQLLPGYFTKIDNAYCSDGKITKVPGSTAINTTIASQPFNGFSAFEKLSSASKWLVVSINGASNAQLYQSTGGNFSAIGSANLTNNKPVWFEVANDIIYGFNGSEEVDWDGTTVTVNRSGLPKGFTAKWFHNYLFVGRTTANPNRLFWSNLGDPTTFSGSNFVDVNPGDSDQIMALAPFQDELLVFKRNTIWSITGFSGSSFSSTTIATQNTNARIFGYGTIAPFSVVPAGNDIYFFSSSESGQAPVIRSLYKTINSITLGGGVVSDNIKTTLSNISLGSVAGITSAFDGRYIYWAIPTSGSSTNNEIIVLDTKEINRTKGIYPFTTMSQKNASYLTTSTIPGYSQIYFTDAATTGLVFKVDPSVSTDNGTAITMDVRTRDYFSESSRKSKWKYLYTTYKSGTAGALQVKAKIDQGTAYNTQASISLAGNSPPLGMFILGTSTLGGQTLNTTRVALAQLVCHYLNIQFLEATANPVELHKWELWFQPKALRNG